MIPVESAELHDSHKIYKYNNSYIKHLNLTFVFCVVAQNRSIDWFDVVLYQNTDKTASCYSIHVDQNYHNTSQAISQWILLIFCFEKLLCHSLRLLIWNLGGCCIL